MNRSKSFARFFSSLTTAALLFGLVAVPRVEAATEISVSNPPEIFNLNEDNDITFTTGLVDYQQNENVKFTITGPIGEASEDSEEIDSHIFVDDQFAYPFVWDGQLNGNDADPGIYEAKFVSDNLDAVTHEFVLANTVIDMSFVVTPDTTYAPHEDGDFEAQVKVDGNTEFAKVEFGLMDLSENNPEYELIGDHSFDANEGFTFTWDGTLNGSPVAPGNYRLGFATEGYYQYYPYILEHDVEVLAAPDMPTLSFDPNPSSAYTLGNDYEAKVKLSNYESDVDVEMKLEGPDGGDEVSFVADSAAYDANETNTLSWDGQLNGTDVEPGDYTVTISADGVDNELAYKLTVKEAPVVDETCEGFTDLDKDYKYCDEIGVVKKAGLMTGQEDGTFDTGKLNRAEQVTVLLRLLGDDYDEAEAKADCTTPFPDVACSAWYGPKVYFSQKEGYVTGYKAPDSRAGTFGPDNDVLQSEALVLFHRILDINTNNNTSAFGGKVVGGEWYSVAYNWAEDEELLPSAEIDVRGLFTREQTARVLAKLIENEVIDVDAL